MKKASTPEEVTSLSQGNYSTHLVELELLLVDQLQFTGQPWPFGSLIERMKGGGFTRAEIVAAVNKLEAQGVIKYCRHTNHQSQPWPRVELRVELIEVQQV
jgi:hypothetical protein